MIRWRPPRPRSGPRSARAPGATDQLLPDQELVVVLHALVAPVRGDGQLQGVDQRHRACGDHAQTHRVGHRDQLAPGLDDDLTQAFQGVPDRGVALHNAALQFVGVGIGRQVFQQFGSLRHQFPGQPIDDVKLFFYAQVGVFTGVCGQGPHLAASAFVVHLSCDWSGRTIRFTVTGACSMLVPQVFPEGQRSLRAPSLQVPVPDAADVATSDLIIPRLRRPCTLSWRGAISFPAAVVTTASALAARRPRLHQDQRLRAVSNVRTI